MEGINIDGEKYYQATISEKEKAVIDLMRKGAKVSLYMFDLEELQDVDDAFNLFKNFNHVMNIVTDSEENVFFSKLLKNKVDVTCAIKKVTPPASNE